MLFYIICQDPEKYSCIETDDIEYRLNKINQAIKLEKSKEIIRDYLLHFYYQLFIDILEGGMSMNMASPEAKKAFDSILLEGQDVVKTLSKEIAIWYEFVGMEYPANLSRLV